MPSGRLPNPAVHKHFVYKRPENGKKLSVAVCRLCGGHNQARNTSREEKHLLSQCPKYHKLSETTGLKLQTNLPHHFAKSISSEQKRRIDQKLAFAIFKTGRPFTLFEDSAWLDLFSEFGYSPPSATTLSEKFLEEAFIEVEKEVNYQLRVSPFLNIVTDESTDISGNRIINTSMITTSGDSFYISNLEAEVGKLGAEEWAEYTIKTAKQITNGDLSKVSSITTDTCSTIRSLWKRLENEQDTKHIFTIPCDSHGLQLIFKDLLQQPTIKQYWNQATTVVNTLRNSAKQHSFLYEEQERIYKGRRKALVASVITRWGTQYSLLESINNSKEALRSFAFRDDADYQLKNMLTQNTFWAAITELLELFKPIHEAQKMSEDNRATISYVYSR
jgi:hypothetical protein